jgi:hypothetical protein
MFIDRSRFGKGAVSRLYAALAFVVVPLRLRQWLEVSGIGFDSACHVWFRIRPTNLANEVRQLTHRDLKFALGTFLP